MRWLYDDLFDDDKPMRENGQKVCRGCGCPVKKRPYCHSCSRRKRREERRERKDFELDLQDTITGD